MFRLEGGALVLSVQVNKDPIAVAEKYNLSCLNLDDTSSVSFIALDKSQPVLSPSFVPHSNQMMLVNSLMFQCGGFRGIKL